MAYADFDFYKSMYGGTAIAEQSKFDAMALRASVYLDYITMGKAKNVPELEAVKLACCALAEQYQAIAALYAGASAAFEAESAGMQSQSVGSYSVTYRDPGDSARASMETAAELNNGLKTIAMQYLAHTGLLYRGGGFCGCTHPTR